MIIIECKRYAAKRKVGVEIVRGLYGVVEHENATKGIIATTSYFSGPAIEFTMTCNIALPSPIMTRCARCLTSGESKKMLTEILQNEASLCGLVRPTGSRGENMDKGHRSFL